MKYKQILILIITFLIGFFIGYRFSYFSKPVIPYLPYEILDFNKVSDNEINIKFKINIDSRIKHFENNEFNARACSQICQKTFETNTNSKIESNETKTTKIENKNGYDIGYIIYDCNCLLK